MKNINIPQTTINTLTFLSSNNIKSFTYSTTNPYLKIQNEDNELLTKEFLLILKDEVFEFGYKSRSEDFVRKELEKDGLKTRNWINEIYIKYFHDPTILIGILRLLGRFEEKLIFPQGQTIAIAALTHENDEVKELGVRAFEKWVSKDSIKILKNIKVETQWLQEYIEQVIKDLKEQCHF